MLLELSRIYSNHNPLIICPQYNNTAISIAKAHHGFIQTTRYSSCGRFVFHGSSLSLL